MSCSTISSMVCICICAHLSLAALLCSHLSSPLIFPAIEYTDVHAHPLKPQPASHPSIYSFENQHPPIPQTIHTINVTTHLHTLQKIRLPYILPSGPSHTLSQISPRLMRSKRIIPRSRQIPTLLMQRNRLLNPRHQLRLFPFIFRAGPRSHC
jgi:hypothetical protein